MFNVELINPCLPASAVTISPIDFQPPNPTVIDGEINFTQWFRPTTSVDVDNDSTGGMCGTLSYEVFADTYDTPLNVPEWAVISEPVDGTYRLTFNTTADQSLLDDDAFRAHTLYIKTTLDKWSHSEYDAITVTVNQATCDCSHLKWTDPSVLTELIAIG